MTCENCNCAQHEEEFEEVVEEKEIEVLEFDLDEDEINELMEKLRELKETKSHFHFDIDEENHLLINYGGDSEEDEE